MAAPSRAPSASPLPPAPTETLRDTLFEEDFSTYSNHWGSKVQPSSEKGYENGEFRISIYKENWAAWTHPHPPRDLTDYALDVDALADQRPARQRVWSPGALPGGDR